MVWANLVRRLVGAAVLLVVVSACLFAAVELLPGDAATQTLGRDATPERVAELRLQLSLDESPPVRYGRWLADIVRGDLGDAATTRRSVASTIGDRAVNSAVLASVAFAFIVVVAGGLGTVAALRPNGRLDAVVSIGALVAVSVPEFVSPGFWSPSWHSGSDGSQLSRLFPPEGRRSTGSRSWFCRS